MVTRLSFVFDLLFAVMLFAGIYAVSQNRRQMVIALVLALPMWGCVWLEFFYQARWVGLTMHISAILFISYTISLIGGFIFRAPRVTRNVVYAAIIAYLLIGILWAGIFGLVAILQPGAFAVSAQEVKSSEFILVYYSFVTLTTLGYGDIVPLTGPAYSLVILEAVIGQLYLTVLIARLVGLHIAHAQDKPSDKQKKQA
jgi:hypothetical protein